MFDSSWWLLVTVAAPMIIAAAIAFALYKQRKMTAAERRDLRDAVDSVYLDEEESDECPVRVDTERRAKVSDKPQGRRRVHRILESTR